MKSTSISGLRSWPGNRHSWCLIPRASYNILRHHFFAPGRNGPPWYNHLHDNQEKSPFCSDLSVVLLSCSSELLFLYFLFPRFLVHRALFVPEQNIIKKKAPLLFFFLSFLSFFSSPSYPTFFFNPPLPTSPLVSAVFVPMTFRYPTQRISWHS